MQMLVYANPNRLSLKYKLDMYHYIKLWDKIISASVLNSLILDFLFIFLYNLTAEKI